MDEAGKKRWIFVQRVRCTNCKKSSACLYQFLIPYRRYTAAAFEKGLQMYLSQFCSYADALWSQAGAETDMVISTLFRAMAAIVSNVWLAKQQVQLWLEQSNLKPASEPEEADCANACKARVIGKANRLTVLAKLVQRVRANFGDRPIAFLQRLFTTETEHRFSLLTKGMSATQSLQSALF